jgi:hypothetical protein
LPLQATELDIFLAARIMKNLGEARDASRDLPDNLSELRRGFKKGNLLPIASPGAFPPVEINEKKHLTAQFHNVRFSASF